ncbi:MAG TPA: hypothetical protein VF406_09910 [Thermodesulfobacteriota bacterium]
MLRPETVSDVVTLPDSLEAIEDYFVEQGWSDGLPIVPPTAERVEAMLAFSPHPPDEVIGLMEPRWGEVTARKLAVNAVMAGCRPEYFPVVTAAVEAVLDPRFNLHCVQPTTHPCAPLIVVNGPIAGRLGIQSADGALGPGFRPNATIGRAIRLALINVGGATPGKFDRSTQAGPGKYTMCVAENQAASPWEPLHVERGYPADESTVTVVAVEAPHNLNDHVSKTAQNLMSSLCHGMAAMTMNNAYLHGDVLLLLGPEHAATIAADGWSKRDVKRFVYENARIPLHKLKLGGMWDMRNWPKWFNTVDDHAMIPMVEEPDDVLVAVVGGVGKHSAFLPTVGPTRAVTRPIRYASGSS